MTAAAGVPHVPKPSERDRVLRLDFECLQTLPGGLSDVRVWWDDNLGCDHVGKRIDLSSLDNVLPEPSTLKAIDHDNVVPILVAPTVEGYPAPMRVVEIVTPYYPLGSLTDAFLRGVRFTPIQSIRIVQAALRGLGHLHEIKGIAHRDIKSGNILLTGDEHVARLADLGLSLIHICFHPTEARHRARPASSSLRRHQLRSKWHFPSLHSSHRRLR